MKIKKADMLKFIDGVLKRLENEHRAQHQARIESHKKQDQEWEEEYGPIWDDAIRTLQAARRRKKPITFDMIPSAREGSYIYASNAVFNNPTDPPKLTSFTPPTDLAGMRNLLNAITDEEIDVKQLSMADVRDLYRTYGS